MKYFSDFKIVIDGPYRILRCRGIMERESELVGPTSSGYIELATDVISTSNVPMLPSCQCRPGPNVAQLPNLHSYQFRPALNVAQLPMSPRSQCYPAHNFVFTIQLFFCKLVIGAVLRYVSDMYHIVYPIFLNEVLK